MFVRDSCKRFPFFLIFNFLLYQNVIAGLVNSSSTNPIHVTINTIKTEKSTKSINEGLQSHNISKATTAPVTDREVADLTKIHHLLTTAVTNPISPKNASDDTSLDFVIDDISDTESNLHLNGRFNSTSATIAAVTCLSIAIVAYIGILVWNNFIQKNYEAREILLNEDDIGDINDEDMRHFEAACIEIST